MGGGRGAGVPVGVLACEAVREGTVIGEPAAALGDAAVVLCVSFCGVSCSFVDSILAGDIVEYYSRFLSFM